MKLNDLEPEVQSVVEQAIRAMQLHKRLQIDYHDEGRVIEVHAVGLSSKGKPVIRAYQVSPAEGATFSPANWRLFSIKDVVKVHLTDVDSDGPRPGFTPNDKGMGTIFMEVSNEPVPLPPKSPA